MNNFTDALVNEYALDSDTANNDSNLDIVEVIYENMPEIQAAMLDEIDAVAEAMSSKDIKVDVVQKNVIRHFIFDAAPLIIGTTVCRILATKADLTTGAVIAAGATLGAALVTCLKNILINHKISADAKKAIIAAANGDTELADSLLAEVAEFADKFDKQVNIKGVTVNDPTAADNLRAYRDLHSTDVNEGCSKVTEAADTSEEQTLPNPIEIILNYDVQLEMFLVAHNLAPHASTNRVGANKTANKLLSSCADALSWTDPTELIPWLQKYRKFFGSKFVKAVEEADEKTVADLADLLVAAAKALQAAGIKLG